MLPAGPLSPSWEWTAGLGFGVGVGMGNADGDIGGGVAYGLGQIDAITPAELNDIGGFAKLTTPIMLLYRMLRGSALANIGACARAPVTSFQGVGVSVPELTMVGNAPGGGGIFRKYWLKLVPRHNPGFAVTQVLLALLPWRKEYEYHCPFGD